MEKKRYPLKFVTSQELDPLTASFLNVRFVGFLARLSDELKINLAVMAETADRILREAEIPQD